MKTLATILVRALPWAGLAVLFAARDGDVSRRHFAAACVVFFAIDVTRSIGHRIELDTARLRALTDAMRTVSKEADRYDGTAERAALYGAGSAIGDLAEEDSR